MPKCVSCGRIFTEPDHETFSFEKEYGVRTLFLTENLGWEDVCPYCGSPDIEEIREKVAVAADARLFKRIFTGKVSSL